MARGDFQDNAISLTQPNLSGLGNDVLAAVSGLDLNNVADLDSAVESAIARDLAAEETNMFQGRLSGAVEGQNKLSLFNDKLRQRLLREAKEKNTSFDILLLDYYDQRIAELDGQIEALESCIDALERGETLPTNPDGSLQDEDAETAVRAYEEATGETVDRTDPAALRKVRDYTIEERVRTQTARDEYDARIESSRKATNSEVMESSENVATRSERKDSDQKIANSDDNETRVEAIEARSDLNSDEAEFAKRHATEVKSEPLGTGNPFAAGMVKAVFEGAAAEPVGETDRPELGGPKGTSSLDPV